MLAGLMFAAWWTAVHDQMTLHRRIGFLVLGLLTFRLYWGFFGSSTARFSQFLKGPAAVARYTRTLWRRPDLPGPIGHNPMGGWSVVGLLGGSLAVSALGLFAVDVDGEASGPLSSHVSYDDGRAAAHWHGLLFNALLGLIALHLAAVVFYLLVRRSNLLLPMVTGTGDAAGEAMTPARLASFAVGVGLGAAATLGLWMLP